MALPSTAEPESPEWWLHRLLRRLDSDRKVMQQWWRYHIGDHPAPELPERIRDKLLPAYQAMLRRSRTNFMRLVTEAYIDRMRPIGFWLGSTSDASRDELSWRLWQASMMDADIHMALTWALAQGRAYLSVWHHDGDPMPTIAVEHPQQTIVEHEPGSMHRRRAALKVYRDQIAEEDVAEVHLRAKNGQPAGVHTFRKDGRTGWRETSFVVSPVDAVSIVPIYNRPEVSIGEKVVDRPVLKGGGDSEIADSVPIQDRINETIFNGLLAGWFSAFKQKWATGLTVDKVPRKDSDGNVVTDEDGEPVMDPVEPYDLGSDRLLVAEQEDVNFGEFGETDVANFIKPRERDLEDLTITTRLPRHYLIQQGQAPSGDSMVSAEAGFVGRIRRKLDDFADPLEETVGLARDFMGADPMPVDAELRWDDPENQSLAQLTDSVIKEFKAGLITWEVALERLNYSPQQIRRMRAQRNSSALMAALSEPGEGGEGTEPEAPAA